MGRSLPPKSSPSSTLAGKDEDEFSTRADLLTDKQREALRLLSGPQRHTALVGGARSGKTVLIVRTIVIRALRVAKSRHALLRFNQNAIWPSIGMDTFPFVMEKFFPKVKYVSHRQDGYFSLPNGSEIWLGGLGEKADVDKILGREYASIGFNECSQIPYASVVTALSRLAQKLPGLAQRAYYDLNPVGKGHWTNLLFGEKKDPITRKPVPNPDEYKRMFMNPSDNIANLTPEYIQSLDNMPAKQRERFFLGRYVDETENALWTYDLIERGRVDPETQRLPDMLRIVVAIDPSGAESKLDTARDMIGIMVCGLGSDGHGYVLEDLTRWDSPKGWARAAIGAYLKWRADCIVAEINFGGAMVKAVISAEDENVPFKEVNASRGKVVRAEPVSALYGDPRNELKAIKVHHAGRFLELESELCDFTDLGYIGEKSPNRADSLVWAITELMLGESASAWVEFWKQDAANVTATVLGLPSPPTPAAAAQMALRIEMRGKPHQMYRPNKERTYRADAEGILHEVTSDSMIYGVLTSDVDALRVHDCQAAEDVL
jgi:hypothetical protein